MRVLPGCWAWLLFMGTARMVWGQPAAGELEYVLTSEFATRADEVARLPPVAAPGAGGWIIEGPSLTSPAAPSWPVAPPESGVEAWQPPAVAPVSPPDWQGPEFGPRAPRGAWLRAHDFAEAIWDDHRHFYTVRKAARLTRVFGWGAVLANTRLDQEFQNFWQNEIGNVDGVHAFKVFGEGYIVVPTYVAAMGLGLVFEERPVGLWLGQWGEQSFRSTLVGFPPLLFMQWATGASRPGERHYNSAWRPFFDNNGVSGHAFMGAVPFLTAAQLTDRPLLKATLYAGSTMTALSRINDDAHYLSQAILGWSMAAFAVAAVQETQFEDIHVEPWMTYGGSGLGVTWYR